MLLRLLTAAVVVLTFGACTADSDSLVVYSSRNEDLIRPIFERYTEETGVPVEFITDKAGVLIQRIAAEGERTRADLLLTVDAGNLWKAKQDGLLQSLDSPVLAGNVGDHLRDPDGFWYGLSVRARTIAYNTNAVDPAELSGYRELADPEWRGRLCLRTSKKVYNQSLVAMMIAEIGEEQTEKIVEGWVANLATKVFPSDTRVLEAIAAGQCDVGIVNSYYLARLTKEKPDLPLGLFWPPDGVHVNISGAGITRHATHRDEAQRLIEWLSAGVAQQKFAAVNLEFPANDSVEVDPLVAAWGDFVPNLINVARAGELQAAAVKLMDRAGYD